MTSINFEGAALMFQFVLGVGLTVAIPLIALVYYARVRQSYAMLQILRATESEASNARK